MFCANFWPPHAHMCAHYNIHTYTHAHESFHRCLKTKTTTIASLLLVKLKCKLPTGFQIKLQKASKRQNNPKKEEQVWKSYTSKFQILPLIYSSQNSVLLTYGCTWRLVE